MSISVAFNIGRGRRVLYPFGRVERPFESSTIPTVFRRLLLAFALVMAITPAQGQQPSPSPTGGPAQPQMLRVARISPWLDEEHPFILTVQITNTTELSLQNVRLRVSVFGRVVTRSGLTQALEHGASSGFIGSSSDVVPDPIEAGGQRTLVFRRVAQGLAAFRSTGVYPIQITLIWDGGNTFAFSAVPYLASAPVTAVNLSVLLPVSRPSIVRADGIFPAGALETINPGQLAQQMNALASHPGIPVTLAPSAATLDALVAMSQGFPMRSQGTVIAVGSESPAAKGAAGALDAIKKAATTVGEIATVPYAPASLPALARHGLRADLLRQITLGRSVVQSTLGRAASLTTLAPPNLRIDKDALIAASSLGVTGAVASTDTLATPLTEPFQPQNFGPSRPVGVSTAGENTVPVLLADEELSSRAASQDQGVLAGQSVIALSAIAWLELPLFSPERVLLVAPEMLPSPPAFAAMIGGLWTAPWVRMRTVGDALSSLPPKGSVTLKRAAGQDTSYLAAARTAGSALATLHKIIPSAPAEIATLDRNVLIAESSEWAGASAIGAALARSVTTRVRSITRAVRVPSRNVTLTSRKGSIPITVINDNEFPLTVRVRLESSKVGFLDGDTHTIELAPPNTTVDFAIEARATGAFPIDVRVESPDGRTVLTRGRIVVRSTAVSAVALAAVGTGVALLLFGSIRRDRRRKHAAAR